MSKGIPIPEILYWQVKGALASGMKQAEIIKKFNISHASIERINATRNYEEFDAKRKKRSKDDIPAKQIPMPQEIFEPATPNPMLYMYQDIHDMARELANIKSILLKMAEAWGVTF